MAKSNMKSMIDHIQINGVRDDWMRLMINIGYWAHLNDDSNGESSQTFVTILVPSRQCCSQLILLGSILASFMEQSPNITWKQLINLAKGTQIFCKELKSLKTFNARFGGLKYCNFSQKNSVIMIREGKNSEEILINEDYFHLRELSFLKPPTARYAETLMNTLQYYKQLTKVDSLNLDAMEPDNILITNKTQWENRTKNMITDCEHKLHDLLFLTSEGNQQFAKVKIKSEETYNKSNLRKVLKEEDAKIIILDGKKAFTNHLKFLDKKKNIITLLDYNEYDYDCVDSLETIADLDPSPLVRPKLDYHDESSKVQILINNTMIM